MVVQAHKVYKSLSGKKRVQRTSEIFFPREDKLHNFMFKPTCNFLFITWIQVFRKQKNR